MRDNGYLSKLDNKQKHFPTGLLVPTLPTYFRPTFNVFFTDVGVARVAHLIGLHPSEEQRGAENLGHGNQCDQKKIAKCL